MKNEKIDKKIADVIIKAISQTNITYLKKKIKVTDTEYDEEVKKPVREVVEENEVLEKTTGEYDVKKIKDLTDIWFRLKESDGDINKINETNNCGVVILPDIQKAVEGIIDD